MDIYSEIEKGLNEFEKQEKIYRASSFWAEVSLKLLSELKEMGIENFRRSSVALSYFVPTYGSPANSLTKEIEDKMIGSLPSTISFKQKETINNFLSGYNHAFSDFRVFKGTDEKIRKPYLNDFSETDYGNPKEQFNFYDKKYSRSSLNYLLGLSFLKRHLKDDSIKTVMEIGGGFGTLGEIMKYSGIEKFRYINIDIPITSYIAWNYLKQIYGTEINSIESLLSGDAIEIEKLKSCSVFNNWQIGQVKGKIDLFVNFISFQEMEPDIVKNYLDNVKRLNAEWILLRNMREGKQIRKGPAGVGVEVPILKDDYINMIKDDYMLMDCDVDVFGYKTVDNFHSELLLFKKK